MEKGFSCPRSEVFPAGLRVLVVDDDPTWLKILEKMLKKCSYEVTTCGLATDALRLLRKRKDGFDIVISDVNMPDMDGFKLLEHVGLEMDLPVIMMSVDGETSRVMKGVQHGACDYLLKPISMKELKNIWQHVFRKKIHEIRDIESHECLEGLLMRSNVSDQSDDGHFLSVEDLTCARKRRDSASNHDEKDHGESSSAKKARVVWSVDLHQKFVKAVNQIGFEKVGPKKILDLMNVPWLTRENVASHLQKYRLYLIRLQKEKENETRPCFVGAKSSDATTTPKEPTSVHQNDAANESYRFQSSEDDIQGKVSEPIFDEPENAKSSSIGFNHSFKPLESEVSFAAAFGSNYSWGNTEPSEIQFRQDHKPLLHLENSFTKLPLPDPSLPLDTIQSIPSTEKRGLNGPINIKSTNKPEYGSNQLNEPINCHFDLESANFGSVTSLASFGDDSQASFQGDCSGEFVLGHLDYIDDSGLANHVPVLNTYDPNPPLRFGFECFYDPTTEYAITDQSLLT